MRRRFTGPPPRPKRRHCINHEIKADYVRVIGTDKKMIGILPIREAMRMASAQGYDLVEIAPNADPPVCRILDYGKFLYEEKAKQQAAKKHQHTVSVRQIRLTLKISEHDFDTKIRKMREFLEAKDRVKVTLRLRGREVVHKDKGVEMMDRILEKVSDIAALDGEPSLEGTTRLSWQAMFVPIRTSKKGGKKKQEDEESASEGALSAVSEETKTEEG